MTLLLYDPTHLRELYRAHLLSEFSALEESEYDGTNPTQEDIMSIRGELAAP